MKLFDYLTLKNRKWIKENDSVLQGKADKISPTLDASTGPVTINNTGEDNSIVAPNFAVAKNGAITSPTITTLDARIVDMEAHVYGLDFNETTGASTRLLDAVGKTTGSPDGVNPIASDFDSIYPWSEMRHVKVAMNGQRMEQTQYGYATFDAEVMTLIPEYWYKDSRSAGHRYMYVSDKKKAGFLYRPEKLIASFPASKVGTEYRSRIGEAPKTVDSYTTFITGMYAQGDGKWSMYDCLHSLVFLSCIEAGTMNHKGAYGRGINSGMPYSSASMYLLTANTVDGNNVVLSDSAQLFYVGMTVQIGTSYTDNSVLQNRLITNVDRTGGVLTLTLDGAPFSASTGNAVASWGQSVPQAQFDAIGDGSGYILQHESINRSHVCYRGIWDLWGNVWQFYGGFMRYDGRYYGCTDPTKYNITDPRGADGWVDLGVGVYANNGYQQIREGVAIDGGTIDVPITWGATAGSETYYSAYLHNFDSVYSGARVLRRGGGWGGGSSVSLVFSGGYDSPSYSGVDVVSRLIRS